MASSASRQPSGPWTRPATARACLFLTLLAAVGGHTACNSDTGPKAAPVASVPESVATAEIGAIRWYLDYPQALAIARQAGKPLWVHFGEHPG